MERFMVLQFIKEQEVTDHLGNLLFADAQLDMDFIFRYIPRRRFDYEN